LFEYIPTTLTSRIRAGLSEYSAHKLMKGIVNGIRALYRLGYIHRDIKPDNILVRHEGNEDIAVLTDFGLTISRDELLSYPTAGTRGYAAPELASSQHNSETMDLYSLGITLIQMLSPDSLNIGSYSDSLESEGLPFVTPSNRIRGEMTNSCWNFIQRLTMKDPANRMTYAELFADPWLNASATDLSNSYISDRLRCVDTTFEIAVEKMKMGGERVKIAVEKVRQAVELYCKADKWPFDFDPESKREIPFDNKKRQELKEELRKLTGIPDSDAPADVIQSWRSHIDFVKNVLLKIAQALASEAAACETLLPKRAISEYKAAIVYTSVINMCQDAIQITEHKSELSEFKDISVRISMIEARLINDETHPEKTHPTRK